jgi:hypothetical protein
MSVHLVWVVVEFDAIDWRPWSSVERELVVVE